MSTKIALYAGSFDPITLGHIDIVESASKFFDKVVVALIRNPGKPVLRAEKRLEWTQKALEHYNVDVVSYLDRNILTAKVAEIVRAKFLVRGIKGVTNLEEEMQLAFNNKHIEELDTVWFPTQQHHYHISSTVVRSILQCYDESIDDYSTLKYTLKDLYVPMEIVDDLIDNRHLYL